MLNMSEKFCLKKNDYQSNWNMSLSDLRKNNDFSDVTLISDDKVNTYNTIIWSVVLAYWACVSVA